MSDNVTTRNIGGIDAPVPGRWEIDPAHTSIAFVAKYVVPYFLDYSEANFGSHHWSVRGWLLVHITGGTLALLCGPMQFWTRLRQKHKQLHRWTGRIFLLGIALASVGAFRLTLSTTFG